MHSIHEDVLRDDLSEQCGLCCPRSCNEALDQIGLVEGADAEVRACDESIVAIAQPPRDARVTGAVDELVMVEVVRRDPRQTAKLSSLWARLRPTSVCPATSILNATRRNPSWICDESSTPAVVGTSAPTKEFQ